jgi:serine/threonine protein kinase
MAPEQAKAGVIEPAADIYSLGVVMYEAFTGKVPFSGSSGEVLVKHITEAVPPIPVASGFEIIIERCLQKKPADRPTISALLELLAPWRGDNILDSRASIPAASTVPLKRPLTDEAAFDSVALRTAPEISAQSSVPLKPKLPSRLLLMGVASAFVMTALTLGFILGPERANAPEKAIRSKPLEAAKPVVVPAEAAPSLQAPKVSDRAAELNSANTETKTPPVPAEKPDKEVRSDEPVTKSSASEKRPTKVAPDSPTRQTKRKRTKPKKTAPVAQEKPKVVPERIPPPKEKLSPGKVNVVAVYEKRPRPVEIFVNGKPKGTTPMRLVLSPGAHIVEIRPVGLPARKREITVKSGRNSPIVFNLSQ